VKIHLVFLVSAVALSAAFVQRPSHDCGAQVSNGPMRVFSEIEAVRPAPQAPQKFPLGNDLVLRAAGSADIHLATSPVVLTSANAVPPGQATITVSSTSQFCPSSADCSIAVDPGTSREEVISPPNWRIDGPTQIAAKFRFPHAAGFHILQTGAIVFDASRIVMNGAGDDNHSVSLSDRNNNPVITLPNNTAESWPNAGIQFLGLITGNNGRPKDLVIRDSTPSSQVRFLNSRNTAQLLTMNDDGVTDFYGSDIYVHGTLHVASLKTDASRSFGGRAQEMSVQSPEMMTMLSGISVMDLSGEARISVPASFDELNQDFRYQLTTIGSFAAVYIAQELQNNSFHIAGGKPGMRVSWQITGVRRK